MQVLSDLRDRQTLLIALEAKLARQLRSGMFRQGSRFFALGEGDGMRQVLLLFETRIHPTHHPFERLTPIFDHMPTIYYLLGRRSAKLGTTSIFAGTISADQLHARMSAKPGCESLCGPVRQQIDWAVPLPINE